MRTLLSPIQSVSPSGDARKRLARARRALSLARVAAAVLALVLDATSRAHGGAVIEAAVLVYSVAAFGLAGVPRHPALEWVDPLLAAGAVAATGGLGSNLFLFGGISAIERGLMGGAFRGCVAGLVVAAGSAPPAVRAIAAGVAEPNTVATWIALFPLAGVAAGLAKAVWSVGDHDPSVALSEANRVLTLLGRLATTMPGGLEIGSAADQALHEIADELGAGAAAVLARDGDRLEVVGSFGLSNPHVLEAAADDVPAAGCTALAASALGLPGAEPWLRAPLRREGKLTGVVLARCPSTAEARRVLEAIADRAALAFENAMLFAHLREMTADEERHRLARELHDGVAQTLTHLRLELELLQRKAGSEFAHDLDRLARSAFRANSDIRSLVLGLRSPALEAGLSRALAEHVRDLRTPGGPSIVFASQGDISLPPQRSSEVFRIAQEAVSNALRHAAPRTIAVTLDGAHGGVRLVVEDDGRGIPKRSLGGGVGLHAMRERAAALGARLVVSRRRGGGTRVELVCSSQARRIA